MKDKNKCKKNALNSRKNSYLRIRKFGWLLLRTRGSSILTLFIVTNSKPREALSLGLVRKIWDRHNPYLHGVAVGRGMCNYLGP